MDLYLFPDGQLVRLRSREHGTYLHADEDRHGVSLSRLRMSLNTAWAVHRMDGDNNHVLLQNAAYGRYLACTDASAPLGCRGFRVAQRNYDEVDEEANRWQAFRIRGRDEILLLRHVRDDFYGYLCANERQPLWNDNVVSVDTHLNFGIMMEWVVEPVPSMDRMPRLPLPTGQRMSRLDPRAPEFRPRSMVTVAGTSSDGASASLGGLAPAAYYGDVAAPMHSYADEHESLYNSHGAPSCSDPERAPHGSAPMSAGSVGANFSDQEMIADIAQRLADTLLPGVSGAFLLPPELDYYARYARKLGVSTRFTSPGGPAIWAPPSPPRPVKQGDPMTELCVHWTRKGSCRCGYKCPFAHSMMELREIDRPTNYKTRPCKNWPRCPYGSRCQFKHE